MNNHSPSHRALAPRRVHLLSLYAACLLPIAANGSGYAEAYAEIEGTTLPLVDVNVSADASTPPSQILLEAKDVSPWDFGIDPINPGDHGMYVFANKAGRVRTFVTTGSDYDVHSQFGRAYLEWMGVFRRDNSDNPTFTLNRSWLTLLAQLDGPNQLKNQFGQVNYPYTEMHFSVQLCADFYGVGGDIAQTGGTHLECTTIFKHHSGIAGVVNSETVPMEWQSVSYDALTGKDPFEGIEPEKTFFQDCLNLPEHPSCFKIETGRHYEIPAYTQQVDLQRWGVPLDSDYVIIYELETEAGQDGMEHFAEAILGDPLDTDIGGFTLNTTHTPVDIKPRLCREKPDPTRFSINNDNTVTDRHTGLLWQRCPLGYTLNDQDSPTDFSDDQCILDDTDRRTWQSALQSAAASQVGGYADWTLPNVKQLESIVETACVLPSVDSVAFPDTPSATFWSSTPGTDDKAWIVSFADGDIRATARDGTHLARLVRPSSSPPVLPLPAIIAANGTVVEGDTGNAQLKIPVILTRASTADVTVDYQTQAFTAAATDYSPASGTLTIPAGELRGEVAISVNGDTLAEHDEALRLLLSNPSSNAYIRVPVSLGTILDDEPVVSVATRLPEQIEGDAGNLTYEFVVSVDSPVTSNVSVEYLTVDSSAIGGEDFQSASGTVTINGGETSALVLVTVMGDTERENDETFDLVISNVSNRARLGNDVATATLIDDDGPGSYQTLNDTGVTYCSNTNSALLECPQEGFPGQDGEYGRDISADNPNDGANGFSFTKLDANGVPLSNQAAFYSTEPWDCAKDEVTGLIWEVKTDVAGDPRHYDWTYTWYNSTGVNDGAGAGVANGGTCADTSNCDTEKYVAAVNAMNLCGYSDWRVPSIAELFTLARTASPSFDAEYGLDSNYFPHNYSSGGGFTKGYSYWSATPSAGIPEWAWVIRFQSPDPRLNHGSKNEAARVRLVRGGM